MKKSNFTIETNIISFLQEQVHVLAREYEYIVLIANFYSGDFDSQKEEHKSYKADLENNFGLIKDLIEKENNKLIKISQYIEKDLIYIREKQQESFENIFIMIDYTRKKINKLINKFEKINEKLIQMLRDGYNQYIPKPIIGKRHSNINLISQLELKINKVKNYKKDNFFLTWKFTHSYQALKLDKKKNMINLSYWIFDTPYLMPTLTHEIIHGRIDEFSNLVTVLSVIINKNSEMEKNRKKIFTYEDNKKALNYIVEDIIIDIVSFLKHGNAYILTLATAHLGYYFASTFKEDIDEHGKFNIAHWYFSYKRDIPMLRLLILVKLATKEWDKSSSCQLNHEKFEQNIQYVKSIDSIMRKLYFEEDSGFKKIYREYHNFEEDYILIMDLFESLTNDILESNNFIEKLADSYSKHFSEEKELDKTNNLPETLNDIWEDRLKENKFHKMPNNIEYRKKVHYKTIKKLLRRKYLSSLDILKANQITFVKTKLPEKEDKEFKYLNFSSIQDDNYYNTLGIYDFVKIKPPTSKHTLYNSTLRDICKKKKHYKSFISLMKIMDDIKGDNKEEEFNTIIQIEVEKNLSTENIKDTYDNLFNDLEQVRNIFNNILEKIIWSITPIKFSIKDFQYQESCIKSKIRQNKFKKVEFYKSLGPKDIVIIVYNCSIDIIYKIKEAIAKKSSLKRSYTTIFYDKSEKTLLNINNKYNLVTEIRANNTSEEDTNCIEKCFKKEVFKDSIIYKIAGVMDYTIIWDENIQLRDIHGIYTKFIQEGHIQDLQTMISKRL